MDGWMDGWMNGWIERRWEGWMDRRMDGMTARSRGTAVDTVHTFAKAFARSQTLSCRHDWKKAAIAIWARTGDGTPRLTDAKAEAAPDKEKHDSLRLQTEGGIS